MPYEYDLAGKIRNLPVQQSLLDQISGAIPQGYRYRITSGGQPAKGSGGRRTGSTRHDHGGAADFVLLKDGKAIRPGDAPEVYAQLFEGLGRAGIPGVGHYAWGVHAGGGNPAFWGPDKRSASADPAFLAAYRRGLGNKGPAMGPTKQNAAQIAAAGPGPTKAKAALGVGTDVPFGKSPKVADASKMGKGKWRDLLGSLFGSDDEQGALEAALGDMQGAAGGGDAGYIPTQWDYSPLAVPLWGGNRFGGGGYG